MMWLLVTIVFLGFLACFRFCPDNVSLFLNFDRRVVWEKGIIDEI